MFFIKGISKVYMGILFRNRVKPKDTAEVESGHLRGLPGRVGAVTNQPSSYWAFNLVYV